MKDARFISPSDVRLYYFGSKDVLLSAFEKENRQKKLQRAAILSTDTGTYVNLYIKLPNGDTLETCSDSIAFFEDFVVLRGGFTIPIWAIIDVIA